MLDANQATLPTEGDPSGPTPPGRALPTFPAYTRAEERADVVVHALGLAGAVVLGPWLMLRVAPGASWAAIASVVVYLAGLLGMLAASAAYNLARPGSAKAWLRRLDRSMIFVMIAGSYTPFAIDALPRATGLPLCTLVWLAAAGGIALELGPGSRLAYNLTLGLYLATGWLVLAFIRPLVAFLPAPALWLLFAGGVLYTAGALLHAHGKVPFHNPIWHMLVAAAAALHFAAVASLFPPPP